MCVTVSLAILLSALPAALSLGPTAGVEAKPTPWVVYEGGEGLGKGKHIVFVTGDEEYRSEEGMPQMAKILSKHHGFKCTVLFAMDPDGTINPQNQKSIPGTAALATADLMVIFTRFRDLPDDQMKPIVEYVESGKPIIGLRTSTHAFQLKQSKMYRRYSWRNDEWKGGFGRQVLGETWIAHHGGHGWQSTGGLIADGAKEHPIVRGIKDRDVWDPTDVYTVRLPMLDGIKPILMGQVLSGMKPDDPPVGPETNDKGEVKDKNNPMMPIAWVREWTTPSGKKTRVFCSTYGTSEAFVREGSRRLLVNASLWALGIDVPAKAKVDIVGTFKPTKFGFNKHTKGVRPADHK